MASATLPLLETLIGFDTVSRNSNLGLIEWLRDHFAALGVPATLVTDKTGTKANLWATIGPEVDGGIILSGHTDVVPVDGQAWTSDPFKAVLRDGKLYGRGACDMKGFVAAATAIAETARNAPLRRPVHFAFSYDEEVGCIGVRDLLTFLDTLPYRPAGVIVGEPTEMKIVLGHKGKRAWCCTVKGHAVHSSRAPEGVNAVEGAARLIAEIAGISAEVRRTDRPDAGFDVPFTTLLTTVMEGGMSTNTVPDLARFVFECRHLPDTDPEAIFARIQAFTDTSLVPTLATDQQRAEILFEEITNYPGLTADPADGFVAAISRFACTAVPPKVAYGTEAGLFQRAGIPALVCGPGSIAQAHRPDEFCALDQLAACDTFLAQVVESLTV